MTESAAIYVNWEVVRSIGRGGAGLSGSRCVRGPKHKSRTKASRQNKLFSVGCHFGARL